MAGNRIKIGNVEVLSLSDMRREVPWDQVFPSVEAAAWKPFHERYPNTVGPGGQFHNNLGAFMVWSQGQVIVVDTGIGPDAGGELLSVMAREGVRLDEVTIVVHTHLHPDHVGWNLSQGKPSFPNARHLVHRDDWAFFGNPENQAKFAWIAATVRPLQEQGKLELVGGDHNVTSEVTTVHTPGHTPGHMSLLIASGGERGVILGDVALHPAQMTEPDWNASFDGIPDLAKQTRRAFLDRIEGENRTIGVGHFQPPSFGRLVRIEGKRYWQGL